MRPVAALSDFEKVLETLPFKSRIAIHRGLGDQCTYAEIITIRIIVEPNLGIFGELVVERDRFSSTEASQQNSMLMYLIFIFTRNEFQEYMHAYIWS